MSILSGRLTAASGLGATPSAGAYTSPSYGGNSTMYPASSTGGLFSPVSGSVAVGAGNLFEGRLTLTMMLALTLALAGIYVWTHNIQGGG